jgi:D-alanyl-D-alanine carboxypeptidase
MAVTMSGLLGGVRRSVLVSALAGLVWALVAPAAGAAPPTAAKLRREADRMIAAGVPGVVVLVRDGSRTVRFARGSSRLKPHRALRVSDRFRIASLTKTYTATVVLQLAGEGKLSLEDPVERWLPGMVPNGAAITLRMLLNHHSGLFDYFNDPQTIAPYLAGDFAHVWTPEQLVAIGVAHPPLFAPNASAAYSNTDYVLLGLVIQAVTGRSLEAEFDQRIFRPLKLRDSLAATKQRIPGAHAHGYLLAGPNTLQDVTAVSPTHAWATGSIVSTANDVAHFYRALLSGRLLRPALLREMTTLRDRFGLGLIQGDTRCTTLGHNGEIAGYNAEAQITRNGRREYVLLANIFTTSSTVGTPKADRAWDRLKNIAACAGR